jgi:hypothetical protein
MSARPLRGGELGTGGTTGHHGRAGLLAENPVVAVAARGIVAALRTLFDFLALNLALLVACLPVVTIPLALEAATVAVDRWRVGGEDRVVREFLAVLRSRPLLGSTLRTGVPILATALGIEEVHFFSRGGSPAAWVCLGLGSAALLVLLASLGYVLLLGARNPLLAPNRLWTLSLGLGVRHLAVTGPLFVLELVVGGLAVELDPPLALLGLPLAVLCLLRVTARLGLNRCRLDRIGPDLSQGC